MSAIYRAGANRAGTLGQDVARAPAEAPGTGSTQEPLLVGTAKRSITPTVLGRRVYLAGYQRGRLATDVHDELWVRAVAIRRREVTLILATLDLIGLFREDVEAIRSRVAAAGVPTDGLIVACTGNHSGPDTLGLWRRGPRGLRRNFRYTEFLRTQVAQVICLAAEAMEPAQAYLACADVDEMGREGDTPGLSVMQLRTLSGRQVATVVNSPLVPRVLPEANTAISADFLNWLYLDLERTRDDTVLYVCAEAGEPPLIRERSWSEAERVGRQLALLARRAVESASPMPISHLAVWRKPIAIPPDRRGLMGPGYAGGRLNREWRRQSEVGVVEFGPLRMVALPGLAAPEMGFELRKALDAPYRWLLCLSNDSLGTIRLMQGPPRQGGYPSAAVPDRAIPSVRVGSHASTIIMDQVADLMLEVRGR
jgi:hypothetical protein